MVLAVRAARLAAVLLGSFMLVSTVVDFAGAVPRSDDEPARTGVREVLGGIAAVILVLPYRYIRREPWRFLMRIGVAAIVLGTALVALQGLFGYLRGAKSWHIVPAVLIFLTVAAANAVAFHVITRREPAG